MKIPKIIYQTHFDLFSDLKPLTRSWKQYHPDYEYHFYNDQMCDEFIKNFSDRVYQAYKTINIGAVKSDLWRYCVLYRTGGVYIDSDTLCRQNITNMLANYEFVSAIDSWFFSKNIFQGFLASVPGHPLLRKVIDQVVYHIENIMFERTTTENHNVIALSGPECFGRVLNRHLERPDKTLFYPGVVKNMLLIQHRPWVKIHCYTMKRKSHCANNWEIVIAARTANTIHKSLIFTNQNGCRSGQKAMVPSLTCQSGIGVK
jgi:mannosyltransferase OCH1-like enzyme